MGERLGPRLVLRVEVGYEITALTPAGREMLATLDDAAFAAFIES